MNLPWIKFYPRDWLGDMQLRQCSVEARGVWFEMLCIMHSSKRRGRLEDSTGKKISEDMLARLIGIFKGDLYRCMEELKAHGVPDIDHDGTWINRRMYRDELKREACSNAGKRGGGSPKLRSESDKNEEEIPEIPDTIGAYKGTFKGQTLSANAPTLKDCMDAAASIGMKPADVENCFHHYNAQGWIKGNGQLIRSLPSLLARWKAEQANRAAQATGKKPLGKSRLPD